MPLYCKYIPEDEHAMKPTGAVDFYRPMSERELAQKMLGKNIVVEQGKRNVGFKQLPAEWFVITEQVYSEFFGKNMVTVIAIYVHPSQWDKIDIADAFFLNTGIVQGCSRLTDADIARNEAQLWAWREEHKYDSNRPIVTGRYEDD